MMDVTLLKPEHVFYWSLFLKGFQIKSTKIDRCEVRYLEKKAPNERAKIVFVHGISANASHWYKIASKMIESGLTVVAPDLPGHGLSEDYNGHLSAEAIYESVRQFLDQTVPEKFILVGNSLGGGLSLRYAVENPSRLKGLVTISPAGGFENQEEWEEFRDGLEIETFSEATDFLARIYWRMPWYAPVFSPVVIKNFQRQGIRQLLSSTTHQNFQVDAQLVDLNMPTLFIWGREEKLFSPKQLEWFKRHLPPSVQVENPERVGHCPQLDNPDWLSDRLLAFSSDLEVSQKLSG